MRKSPVSRTSDGVQAFLKQAPEADVLVNNLGIFEVKSFLEIPDEGWLRFFEVNVLSGVHLTRHYLRLAKVLRHPQSRTAYPMAQSGAEAAVTSARHLRSDNDRARASKHRMEVLQRSAESRPPAGDRM